MSRRGGCRFAGRQAQALQGQRPDDGLHLDWGRRNPFQIAPGVQPGPEMGGEGQQRVLAADHADAGVDRPVGEVDLDAGVGGREPLADAGAGDVERELTARVVRRARELEVRRQRPRGLRLAADEQRHRFQRQVVEIAGHRDRRAQEARRGRGVTQQRPQRQGRRQLHGQRPVGSAPEPGGVQRGGQGLAAVAVDLKAQIPDRALVQDQPAQRQRQGQPRAWRLLVEARVQVHLAAEAEGLRDQDARSRARSIRANVTRPSRRWAVRVRSTAMVWWSALSASSRTVSRPSSKAIRAGRVRVQVASG